MSTNDSNRTRTPSDGLVTRKYSKLKEASKAAHRESTKTAEQKALDRRAIDQNLMTLRVEGETRSAKHASSIKKGSLIANSSATGQLPNLPCSMEEALRYATKAMDVPFMVLEKAFKDCLGISLSMKDDAVMGHKWLKDTEPDLVAEIDCKSRDRAGIMKKRSPDQKDVSQKHDLKQEIKALKLRLAECRKDRRYLENFTPDQKTPPEVAKNAEDVYSENWLGKGELVVQDLAYLSKLFSPFWETHGAAYLELYAASETKRKSLSKTNQESGSKGAPERDHGKWINHTKGFIEFLNGRKEPHDPEVLQSLAKTFAMTGAGCRDKRTQTLVEEFLSTLSNAALRGTEASFILKDLKLSRARAFKKLPSYEQIKRNSKMSSIDVSELENVEIPKCFSHFLSLAEETVDECLELLKKVLNKGSEKKSLKLKK